MSRPPLPKDMRAELKKLDLGRVNRNVRDVMNAQRAARMNNKENEGS